MSVNADKLVQIVPKILSGGTTGLTFSGLVLSQNPLIPAGRVMQFASAQAVGTFFGLTSDEYNFAVPYFAGPVNATQLPQALYFASYNAEPVAAWLRGAAYTGTLETLQAINDGSMNITIDGEEKQLTDLNFEGQSSFSAIAQVIQTALSSAATVTYSSQTQAFQITSATTGATSSVSFASAGSAGTDVSTLLGLTQQAGATQSQGMDAQTLAACMVNVLLYARDWVTFTTLWEPELADMLALAQWQATYDTRFCYVPWDTNITATQMGGECLGTQLADLEIPGVCPQYNTASLAASVMGFAASLNFNTTNGRATAAYKQFEGQATTVDNDETYDQLLENGYNVYADFATASANYKFYQPGQVSGVWDWLDTYLNAIAIKDGLQLNILDLLAGVNSLPYNETGYSAIRTACLDTINKFIKFGAIVPGVTLSQTQIVQIKQEVGQDISKTLQNQGWYMQITDPGSTVRASRGTPDCKFFYVDGGSIQKIVMSSTAVQ